MAGTAVLRIVVSNDSIKKATATSHGRSRLVASEGSNEDGGAINGPSEFMCKLWLAYLAHVSRFVVVGVEKLGDGGMGVMTLRPELVRSVAIEQEVTEHIGRFPVTQPTKGAGWKRRSP